MSDFPNIDDILSRQRAERQRRGEQDRENEEAARRHRELLEAFHAIRYFTSDAFPPGTDYYVEFARRLTELVHLLSQRGELERLLERVSDISGNDWETERDARTFVAALLRMAHAGQEHELARRLREAVELPFIGRVNEWLRRDLERTFYACHAQPQEPTSEQLVDAVERLQAAPPPGDPAPSGATSVEDDYASYDPHTRQPQTLGELERWMYATAASQRATMLPFPVSLNPPPIPGHDRLSAYCLRQYGEKLSVETLPRLIADYILARDVSSDEARAASLQEAADTLAPRSSAPKSPLASPQQPTATPTNDPRAEPDEARLQLDTREVPLTAPAGTPSPLREAFETVAEALFQAAEMRRCPPNVWPLFEEQARALSDARRAAGERYAAAELYLQGVTDDRGGCALQEALDVACRVNDAVGHIMLKIVPFDQATAHIQAVPVFDLAELLRAMRRQTSRAALAAQRAEPVPTTGPAPKPPGEPADGPDRKGKRINERMMKKLQEDMDNCLGWSVQDWADYLGCSKSTVQGTRTWRTILDARKLREADKATQRKKYKPTDRRRFGQKNSGRD